MGQKQAGKNSKIVQHQISKSLNSEYHIFNSAKNHNDKEQQEGSNVHKHAIDFNACKKINDYKMELNIAGMFEKFILITKNPIKTPKEYTGYGLIFNKEQIKIFEGEFRKGIRNGFGVEFDLQGNKVYEGFFQKGVYHGWGVGMGYQGQFRNGKREGYGIYQEYHHQTDSLRYEGYWKNNKFHGIGCLNIKLDNLKQLLSSGEKIHLGKRYEAQIAKSKAKVKYIGQWQGGALNGIGKLFREQEIYEGEFTDGNYQGNGVLYKKDNQIIKGYFINGALVRKDQ